MFCGAGGMGHGSVRKQGKFTLVCVLAIDANQQTCRAHQLTHPETPVVCLKLEAWQVAIDLIEKYLPQKYWGKLWIHASPPCCKASTQNGTNRDIDAAEHETRSIVGLLEAVGPAVWTIENVVRTVLGHVALAV